MNVRFAMPPVGPVLAPALPPPPLGLQMPPGGGLPGGLPPPVPPAGGVPPIVAPAQPPFAADVGSIARELWNLTSDQTPLELVAELQYSELSYSVPNPNSPANLLKINNSITHSSVPMFFLTIARDSQVSAVHSVKMFSEGFGLHGPAHNRLFAMVGERAVAGGMPPWQMVPAAGLNDWVQLTEYVVPTRAALVAELEADPPAALATTTANQAAIAGVVPATSSLPKMALIPRAWAPYFLKEMSAWSVVLQLEELIELLPVDLRPAADGLLSWAMVACTKESAASPNSALHARWQPAPMDRGLIVWQQDCLQAFLNISNVPMAPPAAALDPTQLFQAAIEVVRAYKPSSEVSKNMHYSSSERKRLRASTSLAVPEMDTRLPAMHQEILSEGRNTRNTQNVITRFLKSPSDQFPVLIYISPELVKDIKECQYSIPFDTGVGDSSRGLSPFAVDTMSLKTQQVRRKAQERFHQASHTTIDDVRALETPLSTLPQDYTSLCQRLNAYLLLLTHTVGTLSFHTIQVRNMYNTLLRRVDIFSTIKPRQILYLLWQIFLDARYFFSLSVEDDEDLPDSTLNVAAQMLERGSIAMDIVGVPEEEFLGLASPGMRYEGYSGPSGGFSQMFPPTDRPTQDFPPTGGANQDRLVNRALPTDFKAVMTPLLQAHPRVNVVSIMNASVPPIKHPAISLGKGTCLNYHLLGVCSVRNCSFKHTELQVTPARMRAILEIIKPNIAAFCQEAARAKRPRTAGQFPT
jgi:hypothetical protein